jgi:hypothetical protein
MATKTKKRRKASTKYDLCCMSIAVFSHPGAPYRVYIADGRNGLIAGRHEAAAFETRKEAERWLRRHCRHWSLCESS